MVCLETAQRLAVCGLLLAALVPAQQGCSGSTIGGGSGTAGQAAGGTGNNAGSAGSAGMDGGMAGGGTPGTGGADGGAPVPVGSDLTTVRVVNLEQRAARTHFTFALPFEARAVPAAHSLTLLPSVPIQVDGKARHGDQSLRHAIVSGAVDLGPGEVKTFTVRAAQAPAQSRAITPEDVLATAYDVTATLEVAGTAYTLSARQLLQSSPRVTWLEGSMVSEWIVGGAFRAQSGALHPTLSGYFHIRAYTGLTQIRTDVVVENGWFKSSQNRDVAYHAKLSTAGTSAYEADLTHWAGARWHRLLWWGPASNVYVKLDKDYLQKLKVAPRYVNIAPTLTALTETTTPLEGADFKRGGFDMGAGGDSPWFGPMSKWDATYFTSTDVRAFRYMIANNDAAGVFGCNGRYITSGAGVHMRDRATGLPATIDDHPNASAGDPEADGIPEAGSSNPFLKDTAHQPLVGYSPYLVTGDYYHLEEMIFWNAYNLMEPSAASHTRQGAKGLWAMNSLRAMAWSYRSLGYAAYLMPDTHPFKRYFQEKLSNNLTRDKQFVTSSGNLFGTWYSAEGNDQYRSFFDDFFTWAVGNLVDLGFSDALPILAYKSKFPVGRMGGTDGNSNGYCFQAAPAYFHKLGPTPDSLYASWAELYRNNNNGCSAACQTTALSQCLGADALDPFSIRNGQTETAYYYSEMQPALAVAVQHGFGTLVDHWRLFTAAVRRPDYASNPKFAILPRNAP